MQITPTTDEVGCVTEARPHGVRAKRAQLRGLDWLELHGRKHYRQIDVERIKAKKHVTK